MDESACPQTVSADKKICCPCYNCSATLRFEPERAGETVQCPQCKMETVLYAPSVSPAPSKTSNFRYRWGTAIGIVAAFIGIVWLVGAGYWSRQKVILDRLRTIDTNVPINGLFGMKLGEPLPASTKDTVGEPINPKDFGPINKQCSLLVTPPEPNSSFSLYTVTLTPTNRLVCMIQASIEQYKNFDVYSVLEEKYGKSGNFHYATWTDGKHTMEFSDSLGQLCCKDNQLYAMPRIEPDKTGL